MGSLREAWFRVVNVVSDGQGLGWRSSTPRSTAKRAKDFDAVTGRGSEIH